MEFTIHLNLHSYYIGRRSPSLSIRRMLFNLSPLFIYALRQGSISADQVPSLYVSITIHDARIAWMLFELDRKIPGCFRIARISTCLKKRYDLVSFQDWKEWKVEIATYYTLGRFKWFRKSSLILSKTLCLWFWNMISEYHPEK